MLSEFEMLIPETLPEALELMSHRSPGLMPVAGGTNLVVDMRSGRHKPSHLLDLSRLENLQGIRRVNGSVVIGSMTTIADLLKNEEVKSSCPALNQAARVFANPLIRNRATLGGNLADASPASDTAPPLLVMDAEVELQSSDGNRNFPIYDFFVGVRKTAKSPEELITSIRWPILTSRWGMGYYKLGLRKADAISVVSVAVLLELSDEGACTKARIALGSVAPRPIRATKAEAALMGTLIDQTVIEKAGEIAAGECSPISDLRASAEYRRRMVGVLVRRSIEQALIQTMQEVSHGR
jgi:xanthine dehydrogenase FAD-binding subunit